MLQLMRVVRVKLPLGRAPWLQCALRVLYTASHVRFWVWSGVCQ